MNILGFNIGQNYKGILNLGSTINTPLSATLQSVTDGMGVASPLQLSTTQVAIGIGALANGVLSIKTTQANTNGTIAFLNNGAATIAAITDSGSALTPMIFRATEYRFTDATGLVIGRGYTDSASARLHVRGDGTNPILRTEDNSGNAVGFVVSNNSVDIYGRNFSLNGYLVNIFNGLSYGPTSGTVGYLNFNNTIFGAGAGSANFRPINIAYTINNSGAQTGTATGIFLNATETALNGMTHNLMDLGTGGGTYVSRFRVGSLFTNTTNGILLNNGVNSGFISLSNVGTGNLTFGHSSYGVGLQMDSNGIVSMLGVRMVWGGTTNAFPALKRNGAALEVRLADDVSGFANITAAQIYSGTIGVFSSNTLYVQTGAGLHLGYGGGGGSLNLYPNSGTSPAAVLSTGGFQVGVGSSIVASAILQADSTTRGFLPPRQTEAQRLAIAGGTPAIGLMVYQTDGTDGLYVYKAGGWQFIA